MCSQLLCSFLHLRKRWRGLNLVRSSADGQNLGKWDRCPDPSEAVTKPDVSRAAVLWDTTHPTPAYRMLSVPDQLSRDVCTWRGPCGPLAPMLSGPGPCIPPGIGPRGLGPGPRGSRPRGSRTLASMALASSTRGSSTRGSRPRASSARASITRGSSPRGSSPRGSSPRGSRPTAEETQGKLLKEAALQRVWESACCLLCLGASKHPRGVGPGAEGTCLEKVPCTLRLSLLAWTQSFHWPNPLPMPWVGAAGSTLTSCLHNPSHPVFHAPSLTSSIHQGPPRLSHQWSGFSHGSPPHLMGGATAVMTRHMVHRGSLVGRPKVTSDAERRGEQSRRRRKSKRV